MKHINIWKDTRFLTRGIEIKTTPRYHLFPFVLGEILDLNDTFSWRRHNGMQSGYSFQKKIWCYPTNYKALTLWHSDPILRDLLWRHLCKFKTAHEQARYYSLVSHSKILETTQTPFLGDSLKKLWYTHAVNCCEAEKAMRKILKNW